VTVFFITSLTLGYLTSHRGKQSGVIQMQQKVEQSTGAAKPIEPTKAKDVPQ
jgi:hypothetical protein